MNKSSFYEKYNEAFIVDDGPTLSEEFKKFAREMKAALRFELTALGIKIAKYNIGHYYVSGFVKRDERTLYFSYSMPRYAAISLDKSGTDGFLYRTAQDEKDFHGGTNHFCTWKELPYKMDSLLRRDV